MTHCDLLMSLVRPPGTPPSGCMGSLVRVDPSGARIADDAAPILDVAQNGEGDAGDMVGVELYRCVLCRSTLVVAGEGDSRRLRNDYAFVHQSVSAC